MKAVEAAKGGNAKPTCLGPTILSCCALQEVQDADAFSANPDTAPGSHPAAEQTAPMVEPGQQLQPRMAPFWDESAVVRLSQLPNVERVVCLGKPSLFMWMACCPDTPYSLSALVCLQPWSPQNPPPVTFLAVARLIQVPSLERVGCPLSPILLRTRENSTVRVQANKHPG